MSDRAPEMTSDLSDIDWFEDVLATAVDHFESQPERHQPSWWRELRDGQIVPLSASSEQPELP